MSTHTPRRSTSRRMWAGGVVAACLVGLGIASPAPHAVADDPPPHETTSPQEAARVDNLPTPTLDWQPCKQSQYREKLCAEVSLPLDYDEPDGARITVSVLKVPARNPEQRIGSLFVNPGGPGGSGMDFAANSGATLSPEVLDRFDIIGMDPRGIGASSPLECFEDPDAAIEALKPAWEMIFPVTKEETAVFQKSVRTIGQACGSHGKEMASAMSTSQVARDMEMLRRAVGDEKLSYFGFSYGSYLGQVYANMYPDRVRALVIDGVINPTEWLGSFNTSTIPFGVRIGSAEGADHAIKALMERCAKVQDCPVADPEAALDRVLTRLQEQPITFSDPDGREQVITYQRFTGVMLGLLYAPETVELVVEYVGVVDQLNPTTPMPEAERAVLGQSFLRLEEKAQEAVEDNTGSPNDPRIREAGLMKLRNDSRMLSVICSEGSHPSERVMRRYSEVEKQRSPYFGQSWFWNQAACASPAWKARDEDSYRGPFNKRTSAPVMVVGNVFDPATNVHNASEVARMLPNSRLIIANSWGHVAYRRSTCATEKVDSYLIEPKDDRNFKCDDGWQPFNE
ncbi:MAG: alpha/beta hydrolase [Arachnia propionica]|uniref:alpha/beta hydrolase n=1 Tax=Arachnia propionica TaxID=1750 RepID=UPI00270CC88E|nr:alpha/beta hydrolase [Arachnia propionica]